MIAAVGSVMWWMALMLQTACKDSTRHKHNEVGLFLLPT
jgi:hypothetical protein